jgi:hypothetical protein
MFYYDTVEDYQAGMERDTLLMSRALYGDILLSEENIYKFMTIISYASLMKQTEMTWMNHKGEFIKLPIAKAKVLCGTAQVALMKAYAGDTTELDKHIAAAKAAKAELDSE